jgi:hypothetical protein
MKKIQSRKCIFAVYDLISDTYVALLFLGLLFAYSLKHPGKGSVKIKNTFAESSKEKKYGESCLRRFYIHNDHLSPKPIVQGCSTSCVQCLRIWIS